MARHQGTYIEKKPLVGRKNFIFKNIILVPFTVVMFKSRSQDNNSVHISIKESSTPLFF